jgi:hypothetical protein
LPVHRRASHCPKSHMERGIGNLAARVKSPRSLPPIPHVSSSRVGAVSSSSPSSRLVCSCLRY